MNDPLTVEWRYSSSAGVERQDSYACRQREFNESPKPVRIQFYIQDIQEDGWRGRAGRFWGQVISGTVEPVKTGPPGLVMKVIPLVLTEAVDRMGWDLDPRWVS